MITNKVKKTENYTVVDNGYLRDENLSFKAKGILTYLLSLPGDWVIYFDEVITHSKDGIKSFRSGIDELIKEGYIRRYPIRENGVIVRWETEVYEKKEDPYDQKVNVDNKDLENEDIDKDSLLNTNLQNTKDIKYLNNFNDFEQIRLIWNELGHRVIAVDKIIGEPSYMFAISKLIEMYGYDKFIMTMKSIKYNPFAHRFTVSLDWFLNHKNFVKLYESKWVK